MSQSPQPTSAQALAQAASAAAETPAGRSVFDDLLERNFSKPEVLEVAMASKEMDRMWEKATIYAKSDFIPDHFKNRPNNCFIAVEIATRLRMSELMVMQNLGVVHGKLGFAGQFVIGAINAAKIFDDRLRFQIQSANAAGNLVDNSDASAFDKTFTIRAYALTKGKAVVGPWIDWNVVASEGWDIDKPLRDGGGTIRSKWNTMPDLMFRYRAASWFGRTVCPEVLLGLQTVEEIEDVVGQEETPRNEQQPVRTGMRSATPQPARPAAPTPAQPQAAPAPVQQAAPQPAPAAKAPIVPTWEALKKHGVEFVCDATGIAVLHGDLVLDDVGEWKSQEEFGSYTVAGIAEPSDLKARQMAAAALKNLPKPAEEAPVPQAAPQEAKADLKPAPRQARPGPR